jgi:hypothetical protein
LSSVEPGSPDRASACSTVSQVSKPKPIGIPVRVLSSASACEVAEQT